MSGGDGNSQSNTGLGHNGGQPSGNINGTSGSGPSNGNTGSWSWADVPFTRDPDGQIRINFAVNWNPGPTPNGGAGGIGGGNGSDSRFTSNVANWHEGYGTTGSLNSPALTVLKKDAYQISFGKEKYMVSYDPNNEKYKATYSDGGATKASQLMTAQAIAIVQLYTIKQNEQALLLQTSAIISDAGEKIASKIGSQYSVLSRELANDIKSFQGKNIRNYNDAIQTVNKLMSNTLSHYSAADKTALVNALNAMNASTLAANLKTLAKAFTVADRAIKIESIAEKTVHGIKTGEWGPLALELEAMVMSGIAAGVALGLVGSLFSVLTLGTPVTLAASFLAVTLIAILSSFIDAGFADRVNNQISGLIKK